MKIKYEFPPIYDLVTKSFGSMDKYIVYTYGDTIYSPHGIVPSDNVIVHETVHSRQQDKDPQSWWERYVEDKTFRLEQELEAYRAQYQFYKTTNKDRNDRARFRMKIAGHLSGSMYGSMITLKKAMSLIGQ